MTSLVVHALANGLALWVISQLHIGVDVVGWMSLILAAVILGLVNAVVRPILSAVTCVINVLTLGLFSFVLNAVMLWVTSWVVSALGFEFIIEGVVPALIAGVLIGLLNAIISPILFSLFKR